MNPIASVPHPLRPPALPPRDPTAVLTARVAALSADAGDDELSKFWDSVLSVPAAVALDVIRRHPHAAVKVPTRDGGWTWPREVIDLDEPLIGSYASRMLDRQ